MKAMQKTARTCAVWALFVVSALALASPALAATYEYDALGRLIKVTYDDGSVVEYAYDAAGNRETVDADAS